MCVYVCVCVCVFEFILKLVEKRTNLLLFEKSIV